MNYLSPKELSAKFAMPLRTVYYNIANSKQQIRMKKEGRSKIYSVEDFTKACNFRGVKLQDLAKTENKKKTKSQLESDTSTLQTTLATLQSENATIKDEKLSLQKFNTNLQDQVSKYALLLTEEKNERKELLDKYDTLQNRLQTKIENLTKRFYFLLGIAVLLIAIIALQFAPMLQSRFSG